MSNEITGSAIEIPSAANLIARPYSPQEAKAPQLVQAVVKCLENRLSASNPTVLITKSDLPRGLTVSEARDLRSAVSAALKGAGYTVKNAFQRGETGADRVFVISVTKPKEEAPEQAELPEGEEGEAAAE